MGLGRSFVMIWICVVLICCPDAYGTSVVPINGSRGLDEKLAFRSLNTRSCFTCPDANSYLSMSLDTQGPLGDVQNVVVTVSGILVPQEDDWVGVIAPSSASVSDCPANAALYVETGDVASLPLLCHYPVKFLYVNTDPGYMSCSNSVCQKQNSDGSCEVKTCSANITFRLINIRSDILFVFFANGMKLPCTLANAGPLKFANPNSPVSSHINSVDSTGTQMRVTWTSGDSNPQLVRYADGMAVTSVVSTYKSSNMSSAGPAGDFGFHDPGFIHTAVMTGLSPKQNYNYQYGSDAAGWSSSVDFITPPAAGDFRLKFIMYGDMGTAERDGSLEHYVQPGSLSVIDSIAREVDANNVDVILHIGDISYATGFTVKWDSFLEMIHPVAGRVSYLTAIGNHERDYPASGSYYSLTDSGGENGVPYYAYFQMPIAGDDSPWFSFESGPVHFTIMSTEHDYTLGTNQYKWIESDLASVDRSRTPWLVYTGHRQFYSSSYSATPSDAQAYLDVMEPLFMKYQVDLVLYGHVHNYERTCAVYQSKCAQLPAKDESTGIDTYHSGAGNYYAPVFATIGMAGFSLQDFASSPGEWSLSRYSEYGYTRMDADANRLLFQFVQSSSGNVLDSFQIMKS